MAIVMIQFSGYDINQPRQDTINCQKLLRDDVSIIASRTHILAQLEAKSIFQFLLLSGSLNLYLAHLTHRHAELPEIANSFGDGDDSDPGQYVMS